VILASALGLCACSDSVGPGIPKGKTHPAGVVAATVAIGARPYGIGLFGTTGVVTQLDASQIVRFDIGSAHVVDSIRVGTVPTGIVLFANGTSAAVTNQQDATIGFVDLTAKVQTVLVSGPSNTFRVLTSRDEKHLYATASVGSLGVIALPGHTIEKSLPVGGGANGLALSPDGNKLYVSATSGVITVVDTRSNTVARTINLGGLLQDIAVSLDGKELYVADEASNQIHVVDEANGTLKTNIEMGAPMFGLSLTPDGTQLYATSALAGMLWVVDRVSRAKVSSIPVAGTPRRIAFDESGAVAVVSNEGGWVSIIH
jgi:YVTN family beta-propeller protein